LWQRDIARAAAVVMILTVTAVPAAVRYRRYGTGTLVRSRGFP